MQLLGKEYNEETLSFLQKEKLIGSKLVSDERGLIGYQINTNEDDLKNKVFTSEEILAMILEHAQKLAQNAGKNALVKDVAITIPSYFS